MSTLDPTIDNRVRGDQVKSSSFVAGLTSSDHKVIGAQLIALSLLGTIITGVLGILLGLWRVSGDGDLFAARAELPMFSGFRMGLVFGGAVPFLLGVSVFAVPLQLGARALAFPRLAAAGMWTWLGGLILLIIGLSNNGAPGGTDPKMVALYVASSGLMFVGLAAVALSVATSVLTTRAPGMKLSRVPMYSWAALVHALGLVLALPVAFGVVIYLYLDVRYGTASTTVFGGSAGINDWVSFLLTGPALALFAVPAVGLLGELATAVFGKRLPQRGLAYTGIALVGVGVFAAVMQQRTVILPGEGAAVNGHNWLTKLGELLEWAILTLLPVLGILMVLAAIGMVAKPERGGTRPRFVGPFVPVLLGVLIAAIGILGAAINGIEDLGLIGTVFEEGSTVAVVYGAALAGLGGVLWWAPKWSGRSTSSSAAAGIGLIGAAGAVLASLPYWVAGFADQPGMTVVYDYSGPSGLWNVLVLIGHTVFVLAVIGTVALVATPGMAGAGDDPWDAQTLDWAQPSPAPADNFATTPMVTSPEPLLDLKASRE